MRQETVRLFTALEIPESLRSALAAVPGSLKAQLTGARWVPARSMHITLHFIGSVPRESLPEELTALHRAEGDILRRVCGLRESGAYRPHVTLARVRGASRASLEAFLHENASPAWAGKSFPVSSSALVKSDLTPAGSVYHIIERFFPGP